MAGELLTYYERELSFLRQMGAEFATKYPKIASRLLIESDKCEDPHVERLIQAFALLAARIRYKLDDDFPEITDALLGVVYPHCLAPIPSMAIVQCVVDPHQGNLNGGYHLTRGTTLYSQPVQGTPCQFRTCYPVHLWPIEVAAARLEEPDRLGTPAPARAVLKLRLRCLGNTTLSELTLDQLRFFLHGESQLVHALYELLFNHVCAVQLRPIEGENGGQPLVLSRQCLRDVGFNREEEALPYTARSFHGYRLLHEYFAFPEKFLFFDLGELDRAALAGFQGGVDVMIYLDHMPRLEQPISAETFRLGCTPVINLFDQIAEPIRVNHYQTAYRVIPDVRRQDTTEVHSINSVTYDAPRLPDAVEIPALYSARHVTDRGYQQAFWHASRQPSERQGDMGTEVYLSLVDLGFQPTTPGGDTLTVRVSCTNRELPGKLPFGGAQGDFDLAGTAPLSRIRCLTKPTDTIRPPLRRAAQWRLVSHLSLNYLSLTDGGPQALREILKLYDFADSAVVQQQLTGITNVTTRQVIARPASMTWNGVCRGLEVNVEFDEDKYVGSGLFLFASVLERFFGLYTALNSFTQMIATTQQRKEPLKRWPPRAGEQTLL